MARPLLAEGLVEIPLALLLVGTNATGPVETPALVFGPHAVIVRVPLDEARNAFGNPYKLKCIRRLSHEVWIKLRNRCVDPHIVFKAKNDPARGGEVVG